MQTCLACSPSYTCNIIIVIMLYIVSYHYINMAFSYLKNLLHKLTLNFWPIQFFITLFLFISPTSPTKIVPIISLFWKGWIGSLVCSFDMGFEIVGWNQSLPKTKEVRLLSIFHSQHPHQVGIELGWPFYKYILATMNSSATILPWLNVKKERKKYSLWPWKIFWTNI